MTSLTPHRDATLKATEIMLAKTAALRAENSIGGCVCRVVVALQPAQALAIADEADAGRDPNLIATAVEHAIANLIAAATGSFTGGIQDARALTFATSMTMAIMLKLPRLVGPGRQDSDFNCAEVPDQAAGRA